MKKRSKQKHVVNEKLSKVAGLLDQTTDLLCDLQNTTEFVHPLTFQLLKGALISDLVDLTEAFEELAKVKAKF